jgi:hypothetical protein
MGLDPFREMAYRLSAGVPADKISRRPTLGYDVVERITI